jgi:transcription-repair coupling factor (superfamily II helicase)
MHVEFEDLVRRLAGAGYVRVDQVEDAGEFSVRGGIVDVFPVTERVPVRVEFWGDEVESLRAFSVYSQRSLGPLGAVDVYAAAERRAGEPAFITSLLPEGARVVEVDPARARARVEAFQADLADLVGGAEITASEAMQRGYVEWEEVAKVLAPLPSITLSSLAAEEDALPGVRATSGELPVTNLPEAEEAVQRLVDAGYRVVIAFEQRAEAERAGYVLRRVTGTLAGMEDIAEGPGVTFLPRALRRHFMMPDLKLALLTDALVFPRRHKAVTERRPLGGLELSSFRDLRKGDYVVHEDHGVGRFEGISTKTVAGVTRDYLDLAYKGGAMLYIPHDQISKVMRYVGAGGAARRCPNWAARVGAHQERCAERPAGRRRTAPPVRLAADGQGVPVLEDGEWQVRFEKAFPYDETEDQLRAIDASRMTWNRPSPWTAFSVATWATARPRALRPLQGDAGRQTSDGARPHHHPCATALRHLP